MLVALKRVHSLRQGACFLRQKSDFIQSRKCSRSHMQAHTTACITDIHTPRAQPHYFPMGQNSQVQRHI